MKFKALTSNAKLTVYIDFKSPYAYIATQPCIELEKKLDLQFDWRPLTLDIPSFLGSAKLDKKGKVSKSSRSVDQWVWVKHAYKDARRYAALNNLTLRGTEKIWDSSLASIGLMWAKKHSHQILINYINAVYEPFWRRDLDIENIHVIEEKLKQAGADTVGFSEYLQGEGREAHAQFQEDIFEARIFGVPSFVIEGEIFFGREHLPRIEWILRGRRGEAPDIAYQNVNANHQVSYP